MTPGPFWRVNFLWTRLFCAIVRKDDRRAARPFLEYGPIGMFVVALGYPQLLFWRAVARRLRS